MNKYIIKMGQETKDLRKLRLSVSKYQSAMIDLEAIIKNSPFKISFFAEKLEISRTLFYYKRKRRNFTTEEMYLIIDLLEKSEK